MNSAFDRNKALVRTRKAPGLLLWLLLSFAFLIAAASAAHAEPLFGAEEVKQSDLTAFTKWLGVLERSAAEIDGPAFESGRCKANSRFSCFEDEEATMLAEARELPLAQQLDAVNQFVNRITYVEDLANWGTSDYWASPKEFYQHNGDCEDFAIAKFMLLKRLGADPAKMRLVILKDMNLGIDHAVLMVETDEGRMILDNQFAAVLPDSLIPHYRPIYSINETSWWLHLDQTGAPVLSVLNR